MVTWPLVAYFAFVVCLVTVILIVSYLIGPRHSEAATGDPYEGGIVSEGSARSRFAIRYNLIAMLFVILDLEAVIIYAWAGAARDLGWSAYWAIVLFVGMLIAPLVYLWKVGALDWSTEPTLRGRL